MIGDLETRRVYRYYFYRYELPRVLLRRAPRYPVKNRMNLPILYST
jgi:hypothetical protein